MTGPGALRQLYLNLLGFRVELGDFEGADLAFADGVGIRLRCRIVAFPAVFQLRGERGEIELGGRLRWGQRACGRCGRGGCRFSGYCGGAAYVADSSDAVA